MELGGWSGGGVGCGSGAVRMVPGEKTFIRGDRQHADIRADIHASNRRASVHAGATCGELCQQGSVPDKCLCGFGGVESYM